MNRKVKALTGLLLILFASVLHGQQRDSTIVTFRVTRSAVTYEVFPKDSILWGNQENKIQIRAHGKKRTAYVMLEGGHLAAVRNNDSLYTATVNDTVVTALLSIREKMADGGSRLVFSKPYRIKRIPPPVLYVCGVKTDSVIDKQQLIVEDLLYARSEQYKFRLIIESFDMIVLSEKGESRFHSVNNHFTLEQRREIHKLVPGNTLFFENIRCLMPSGEVKTLKPVQIFIDDTNKYKVGLRKLEK
ncbi:MAG TPA: hypothetical protein VNZ86_18345 [Bacteroidia bacterium]|jgi:hypothetical protein|nr:hypothetical protein [Bacteroidia bacterium]